MPSKTKKLISYVLPVYNESEGIENFYKELVSSTKKLPKYNYEFVFINDGSKDDSRKKLEALFKRDKQVKIINFSRNFGHQIAITAGLDIATGDAIIVMDTDLQDPPDVSLRLIKKWENGNEVVYAKRRTRIDSRLKRLAIYLYYRLQRRLADIDIPVDTGDFRLIDKKVLVELRRFHEKNPYIRGLVSYIGFRQTAVIYDRAGRFAGETKYPFRKLVKLALDGITGFSTAPLKLITRAGFAMSFLSILGIAYVLITRLFYAELTLPGWAVMMIVIFLSTGIEFIILGTIGSYIGRIYSQVQDRPLYIVESLVTHDK